MPPDLTDRPSGASRPSILPAFVLVSPTLPENIGAVARVLANFGLADLRIVGDAPCDAPAALATAAGGVEVLRRAARFPTLQDALADRERVYATTALPKALPLLSDTPRALGTWLHGDADAGRRAAVVFGTERTGLSLEDVSRADAVVHIPTDPTCRALNLAQSVTICAWEWSAAHTYPPTFGAAPTPAPKHAVERLVEHVARALDARAQMAEPALRKRLLRSLRIAFGRGLTSAEVRTLRGVVSALSR